MTDDTEKRRQDRFLDGIEMSMRFCDIAYKRLVEEILEYNQTTSGSDRGDLLQHMILMDVWSIVDAINRLRDLVEGAPGIKKTPSVTSLLKQTEAFGALRNHVQHLREEAGKVAQGPIWGHLSWAEEREAQWLTVMLIPGRVEAGGPYEIVNPVGIAFHGVIDMVSLYASGVSANLSVATRAVGQFKNRYERSLMKAEADRAAPENALAIHIEA